MKKKTEPKVLHLFTANFPYGISESYLENEVPVLAKKFDTIFIHPLSSKKEIKRTLPNNVLITEAINERKKINPKKVFFTNFLLIFKILLTEFIHCPNKYFFLKNIRLYNSLIIKSVYDSMFALKSMDLKPKGNVFYSYWMNDWALTLTILKIRKKIDSFVFRCGGFDIYDERHEGNYLPFRYYIYKHTSAIFPNSKNGSDYIKKKNIFSEKIKVQYWGTFNYELNNFDANAKFTIVSCSNLIPLKRVHLIVEILKFVTFDLNWIHFGDGECFEMIKQLSAQLPVNINCELKGEVQNNDIIEFYKSNSVNLFITTSETESLPVSIQEAISFGIPVIATNVGGMAEIVNEQTGYLIDKNFDVKKIAEMINHFKDSTMNSTLFRKGVRKFWLNNFEASKVYEKFYEEIIKY